MLRSRFFWFLVVILIGAAAGLYLGWYARPLSTENAPASALRADYKTDYILMVAEIYRAEKNASLAANRLAQLDSKPALRLVQEAILSAGELGYSSADLDLLARLAQGLSQLPGGQP